MNYTEILNLLMHVQPITTPKSIILYWEKIKNDDTRKT